METAAAAVEERNNPATEIGSVRLATTSTTQDVQCATDAGFQDRAAAETTVMLWSATPTNGVLTAIVHTDRIDCVICDRFSFSQAS